MLVLLLLVAALACFLIAAFSVTTGRVSCLALGAALATIALIVERWPG